MKEFDVINKYFKSFEYNNTNNNNDIIINIGDDCAVVDISNYSDFLITTDTLVSGTHFLLDTPADTVGYKSIAVSISDIAAMGGIPKWMLINLTLSNNKNNKKWLEDFSKSVNNIANQYNIHLVGGDTTSSNDNIIIISVTMIGIKNEHNKILTRDGAQFNDGIFITGDLGAPSFILDQILNNQDISNIEKINNKLYYPTPRIQEGLYISQYANSAIDLSDGLLADLGHLLSRSNKSAELFIDNLPVNNMLNNSLKNINIDKFYKYILAGGDEYELIFTAPIEFRKQLEEYSDENKITFIGTIKGNTNKNSDNIIFKDNEINNKLFKKFNIDINSNLGWEHNL